MLHLALVTLGGAFGASVAALAYVLVSLVLSIAALVAGLVIMRTVE